MAKVALGKKGLLPTGTVSISYSKKYYQVDIARIACVTRMPEKVTNNGLQRPATISGIP